MEDVFGTMVHDLVDLVASEVVIRFAEGGDAIGANQATRGPFKSRKSRYANQEVFYG
jgi:hypothetical protein